MAFNFNVSGLTPQDAQSGGSNNVAVWAGDSFNSTVGGNGAVIETLSVASSTAKNFTTQLTVPQDGFYELSGVIEISGASVNTSLNMSGVVIGDKSYAVFVDSLPILKASTTYKNISTTFQAKAGEKVVFGIGNGGTSTITCNLQRFAFKKI